MENVVKNLLKFLKLMIHRVNIFLKCAEARITNLQQMLHLLLQTSESTRRPQFSYKAYLDAGLA